MNKSMNKIRGGNFSHSGKAELYPEFVLCDMGPFRKWCVSASLDAYSYAAAGRKLTLNEGLGKEKYQQRKRAGIAPCPKIKQNYLHVAQHALARFRVLALFLA
jgi:hypothetical protein